MSSQGPAEKAKSTGAKKGQVIQEFNNKGRRRRGRNNHLVDILLRASET